MRYVFCRKIKTFARFRFALDVCFIAGFTGIGNFITFAASFIGISANLFSLTQIARPTVFTGIASICCHIAAAARLRYGTMLRHRCQSICHTILYFTFIKHLPVFTASFTCFDITERTADRVVFVTLTARRRTAASAASATAGSCGNPHTAGNNGTGNKPTGCTHTAGTYTGRCTGTPVTCRIRTARIRICTILQQSVICT